jgi:hypothetical protein
VICGLRPAGLCVGRSLGEENEGPSLSIVPESPDSIYQRALGKSSVFTCQGRVDSPERLTDLKWWWPDGKPIEYHDNR